MKKYNYSVFLCMVGLMILTGSCSNELLNQENPNAISVDNFYKDAKDAQIALVGAYSPLSTHFSWGRYLPLVIIRRSDEYTPSYLPGKTEGIMTKATDIFLPTSWAASYKVIFRTNAILENVPSIDMDATEKDQVLGQAYFLRALSYFYLVNTWENVPLITNAAKGAENFFPSNSTAVKVWEQIISDAAEAQKLLPVSWSNKDAGRATKGAASALLGKSYLYTKDWGKAGTELKKVVNSIYSLTPNYADNFKESTENNVESVFEIQFQKDVAFVWEVDVPGAMHGAMYTNLRAPVAFGGEWVNAVNPWILDAFLEEKNLDGGVDERAYSTIAWNNSKSIIYENKPFQGSSLDPTKVYAKKYTGMLVEGRQNDGDLGVGTGLNYRLIRFADVLLMYAEALNESGGSESEILTSLNRVRQRANMPSIATGLNQSQLRDKIRKERILELSLETDRFFDLKRWGVLVDRMNKNADMVGNIKVTTDQIRQSGHPEHNFPFSEIHTRVPIPSTEISSNPNLTQNPGY
jgi:hypothetical protein